MSSTATLSTGTSVDGSRPAANAPAGWYHDPLGLPQVRWWNGLMWTNEVQEPRPEIQVSSAYRTPMVGRP